jgi:F-type H+-transporting ATPase subunit epsilon
MFNLAIVTPEKIFYEGEVASLIVPGSEGYLGTLTDHAPLITAIVPGKVTLKDKSQQEIEMAVSYGFFEISNNTATLLVDSVEYAADIDLERSKQALERAKQRLVNAAGDIDIPRAQRALEKAKNRLRIGESEEH